MSRLLIDEPPLQVLPTLAVAIGLNEAIALQQLHFRLQISRDKRDGRPWWPRSIESWQEEEFPFWSTKTIDRVFNNLQARGLVEWTDVWNNKGRDRTKWYTINYEAVEELTQRAMQIKLTKAALGQRVQLSLREEDQEEEIEESSFSFTSSVVGFFTPEFTRAMFGPQEPLPNGKNAHTVWEITFGQLLLSMPREAFDTWVRGLILIHHAGGVFTFDARNIYAQAWLRERLAGKIVDVLEKIAGCPVEVRFVLASDFVESEKTS